MPGRGNHGRHETRGGNTPLWLLLVFISVISTVTVAAEAMMAMNMRDNALRDAGTNLANITLALAEQAERSLQGLDLVFTNVAELAMAEGALDPDSFLREMSDPGIKVRLGEKLTGLPYVAAIAAAGRDGRLINMSGPWADSTAFTISSGWLEALRTDPELDIHVGVPLRSGQTGQWSVILARRVRGPDGSFMGVLLGSLALPYFEDLYKSVSMGEGRTIALMRRDGLLLAQYPSVGRIGEFAGFGTRRADDPTVIRADRMLPAYPVMIAMTQTRESALREWQGMAWMLGLITVGSVIWLLIAGLAVTRWWHEQRARGIERSDRAEAERARAIAEADLARERERSAEEASKAKSNFLATMSHEIRTPMNGVIGLAGTLLEEPLAPQHRRIVEAIRDSGDSLLCILNDILDLSKLEAGRMTFEDTAFAPATLTHGAVSILGSRAKEKHLTIAAICDPGLPPTLLGDAGRRRQILLNLVSNAIKFTECGSVTIEARCRSREGNRALLEWRITDTGIGIAPDRIGTLFGEFIQADSSISRRFGGTGLGLAISRRLIEQMGGSIDVQSVIGEGTVFRVAVALPVVEMTVGDGQAQSDVAEQFKARVAAMGRPLRLLFAEDNPTNQFVAMQILKGFDVQVDIADDGVEAVESASTYLYDAICMDMRMPEMDGLAATRQIRRRGGHLVTIPIIALTANAFPEDVKACLDAGMNQFVPKPVHKNTLLSALLTALSSADPAPRREAAETGPEAPALDRAALEDLTAAIGPEALVELISLFQAETAGRLDRLRAVLHDAPSLAREVHILKGAAGTVCAARLIQLTEAIESRLRRGAEIVEADLDGLAEAYAAWSSAVRIRNGQLAGVA